VEKAQLRGANKVQRKKRKARLPMKHWNEEDAAGKWEREHQRSVAALEALLSGSDAAGFNEAMSEMNGILAEAPDRDRFAKRIFGRFAAGSEKEDHAARVLLGAMIPLVERALRQVLLSRCRELAMDEWFAESAEARSLSRQLEAFASKHGVSTGEADADSFVELLEGTRKVELIQALRRKGVRVGSLHVQLAERDACGVVGVGPGYARLMRHRTGRFKKKR
jgi:hypothetical protein